MPAGPTLDSPASMANIHWLQGAHECPVSESSVGVRSPQQEVGGRAREQRWEPSQVALGSAIPQYQTWGGGMGKEAGEPEEGHSLQAGGLAEGGNLGVVSAG